MKITTLILSILLSASFYAQNQNCVVVVEPNDTTVCANTSIDLNAYAAPILFIDTLENMQLSNNWTVTSGNASVGSNCYPNPQYGHHLIIGTSNDLPCITSKVFSPSCVNSGVSFQLLNPDQSGQSPCEGADQRNEGIAVEYTTDGGNNWELLRFVMPHGADTNYIPNSTVIDTSIISDDNIPEIDWRTYSFLFPPSVVGQNMQVRLRQNSSSGTCCDNYAFQELIVFGDQGQCNFPSISTISWSNGATNTSLISPNILNDTTFTATVYDLSGNALCSSQPATINIHPTNPNITLDTLADFTDVYCFSDTVFYNFNNISGGIAPYSITVNNQVITDSSFSVAFSNLQSDTLFYYVEITDACNYTYADTLTINYDYPVNIDDVLTSYDPSLGTYGTLLIDTIPGVNYNWLICDSSYQAVDSALNTLPFEIPSVNNFALELEYNGCLDTTDCFNPLMASLIENLGLQLNISPNPTNKLLNINVENAQIQSVEIYDLSGKLVKTQSSINKNHLQLSIREFTNGTYILKVETDKGKLERRIIKF